MNSSKWCASSDDEARAWLESVLEMEKARDEMDLSKLLMSPQKFLDMPYPPKEIVIDSEMDYRRGFVHGFSEATDILLMLYRSGFVRPTEIYNILNSWLYNDLLRWRASVHRDFEKGPPHGHPKFKRITWWEIRKQVFTRDENSCVECDSCDHLEADHILPVCEGGLPTLDNLRTLCRKCHRGIE